MARLSGQTYGRSLAGLTLGVLFLLVVSVSLAGDPDRQIESYLQSGEFAPALALAAEIENANDRDSQLQAIAIAQRNTGVRLGANQTLAKISSAQVRGAVLDHILAQRLGDLEPILEQFGAEEVGGQQGPGDNADFEGLIELIQRTVEPTVWEELGGPGAINEFRGGVSVDADGVLRSVLRNNGSDQLARLRETSASPTANRAVRLPSNLRKVSLTRLERKVQLRLAAGKQPTDAMVSLAGLRRIQYVFVYPDSGDIVLAGPAGDWQSGPQGRLIASDTGRPVLQLEDLVVVLRQMKNLEGSRFGCSIIPRQASLVRTQEFLTKSSKTPLEPGPAARETWAQGIRDAMGQQDIEMYGIDPRTNVARVLIEADYRMKLVGMGLEPGAGGLVSYLDSIHLEEGEKAPPLDVLRWWFTLKYDVVHATKDRLGFEIRGQGVQVLSENEKLTAEGKRVHTGTSGELTSGFARGFTNEFPALAAKYPVYAELQNVFDMALVGALLRSEGLHDKAHWQMACFSNPKHFPVKLDDSPTSVESVVNHRFFDGGQVVAGVSGGVRVDPAPLVQGDAIKSAPHPVLDRFRGYADPKGKPADVWWWD